MFYHRHVVAVDPNFGREFGHIPSNSALFVCDNSREEDTLRGDNILPQLLGTESYNFLDAPWMVDFVVKNPRMRRDMSTFRDALLTATEIKAKLDDIDWMGPRLLRAEAKNYIDGAKTRADLYKLGGQTNVRFAGVTTAYQDPGNFLSHGLMEVQTCVDGVCTWKPRREPWQTELFREYTSGEAVYASPPGAYTKIQIGRIVDFLDENVARIHLKL